MDNDMQTSLIELEGLQRAIKVSLPNTKFKTTIAQQLQHLAKTLHLKGFRKGKVPVQLIESRFGKEVHHEVANEYINTLLPAIFKQTNVTPATTPKITELDIDQPEQFAFTLNFEIFPKVELKPLETLTIRLAEAKVTQADVDTRLTELRQEKTSYHPVERAAQLDDELEVDFVGLIDGEPFRNNSAKDFNLVLGKKRMVPEFETALIGQRVSNKPISFDVHFPKDYPSPEIAGKDVRFEVTIKQISEPKLPPLDDAFAKSLKQDNLTALTEEVHQSLMDELAHKLERYNKEQISSVLLTHHPLTVPVASIVKESEKMREEIVNPEMVNQVPLNLFHEDAEKRVKLQLITNQMISDHQLSVPDEEINANIDKIAEIEKTDAKQLRQWYYEDETRIQPMITILMEKRILELVKRYAKIEIEQKTFKEICDRI